MKKLLRILIIGIFLVVLAFNLHPNVLAEDSTAISTPTPTLKLRQEFHRDIQVIKHDVRQDVKLVRSGSASPSGVRQMLCEAHIGVVKARQLNMATKGLVMLKRFGAISAAVQKFYTEKMVPAGKTVSNYDSLVADTEAKKVALQPLIDQVKADGNSITCDNDSAKTQFQTFRKDADALLKGLRDYRQSVISLLKAVRSVAGEGNSSATSSARPEVTQ